MNITQAIEIQTSRGEAGTGLLQLVGFQVGSEEFGVDILKVQEIIRMQELTRVPNLPGFVEGIINLRGKVIPVIGMRRCFGLEAYDADKRSRIVVVEVSGAILGFGVDAVSEVLRIPKDTIQPPPRLGKTEREYICGVGKLENRLLLLVDLDRLLVQTEETELAKQNAVN
jgi:purine-binding chemotaxis protein CheW